MTRRLAASLILLSLAVGVSAQQPTFRISADLVAVDVLAFRGREPITGLTAGDFELLDNGVPQEIRSITVPGGAHVIVVLDTSASVEGAVLVNLTLALHALLDQLSASDRVSVLTFGDRVRVLARAAEPRAELAGTLATLTAEGATALHDAIVIATALGAADTRPALMVLFTDGADTASWTTATRTLDLLRASNLVVVTVGAGLAELPVTAAAVNQPRPYFTSRTWIGTEATDAPLMLERIAQATGGSFIRVGRPSTLARTFTEIVRRYSRRYVLSYAPQGVGRDDGWHTIEVRLKGQRGTVQAREGYLADSR